MLVPVKWLKEYVDIDMDSKELADRLTMSGSHVDSIESVDKGVEKVVVGKIEKIEGHPDADKLVITTIDIGLEKIQIVTGATNVKEGDYVPVALVGARLPGGIKIKKGKLRGVPSNGMLCSATELGIDENLILKELKDGIYILDGEYELGADIKDIMGLSGEIIDFEITPNRPDCLSIIGMARETAATFGISLKYPKIEIKEEQGNISDYIQSIEVYNDDLCRRYYGRVVKDITIKQSPLWMQRRLSEAGIRPINNIVDTTNYVMLEMGQPIHAFDLEKIRDNKIIVRQANSGEKIVTLDEVERELNETMVVIADGQGPLAIAGVMGGLDSEVTDTTKSILIESANFNGRNVRLASRALGLRTEASAKFEKDLDPNQASIACDRVCQLIEEIGAGKVVSGHIDVYRNKVEQRTVSVRPDRVSALLGVEIPVEKMIEVLNNLELKSEYNGQVIEAIIPSFRQDLSLEADLIEEIGRIYGFDKVNPQPLVGTLTKGEKTSLRNIEDIAKEALSGMGLNEVMSYSFISPKVYDKINLPQESMKRNYVQIMNPLGEDYSVMRTTLTPNMMEILTRNYKHGVNKSWAYEIGSVFIPREIPVKNLPYETRILSIGMYGESDFFSIKGIIDELLKKLGIDSYEYLREENHPSFHPGRTANITLANHVIGTVGEVHPSVLSNYGIKERVYIAELNFELIGFLANLERKYSPLPKYPAITRDIALVIDRSILVKDIEKIVWDNSKGLIETVKLFDVYTGNQIPEDKKSVAYSLIYRSHEKTLTDDEILEVHNKILEKLKEELNADLRS